MNRVANEITKYGAKIYRTAVDSVRAPWLRRTLAAGLEDQSGFRNTVAGIADRMALK